MFCAPLYAEYLLPCWSTAADQQICVEWRNGFHISERFRANQNFHPLLAHFFSLLMSMYFGRVNRKPPGKFKNIFPQKPAGHEGILRRPLEHPWFCPVFYFLLVRNLLHHRTLKVTLGSKVHGPRWDILFFSSGLSAHIRSNQPWRLSCSSKKWMIPIRLNAQMLMKRAILYLCYSWFKRECCFPSLACFSQVKGLMWDFLCSAKERSLEKIIVFGLPPPQSLKIVSVDPCTINKQ